MIAPLLAIHCTNFAGALGSLAYSAKRRLAFSRWAAGRFLANTTPYDYGIFYSAPFFLVFFLLLAKIVRMAVPEFTIEQRQMLFNTLLTTEVAMLGIMLIPGFSHRTAKLETSWGSIYLEPKEASTTREIINFIVEQKQQGRRVVVLPEAPIMYAFTGTQAPSRWYTLLPGFFQLPQEDDYIADLEHADPDYIVLTNRNTGEYGAPYFGIDYDRKIYRWIEDNYKLVNQFGRFRRDGETGAVLAALLYQRTAVPVRNEIPVPRYSTSSLDSHLHHFLFASPHAQCYQANEN